MLFAFLILYMRTGSDLHNTALDLGQSIMNTYSLNEDILLQKPCYLRLNSSYAFCHPEKQPSIPVMDANV